MTTSRYITLRAAADSTSIRTAVYDGVEHLVVPVVAMVGNAVIKPLGSEGPEFVPSEVLSLVPEQWDNRPVLEDHPLEDGVPVSANKSSLLEKRSFGTTFNSRFEDGRLKMEAWINPGRAKAAGRAAEDVIARCRALSAGESDELVEVSVGARVLVMEEAGVSPSGDRYEYRWDACWSDHLAVGLGGAKGACSSEMGCGAPRAASGIEQPVQRAVLRAAVLGTARRPTFTGTESGNWAAPNLAGYVKYLHEGAGGPTSVSQCSMALKRRIAAHSLLGDPDAGNLRELTMFPVVNPANGNLNENALRAVLGGRGSQASIPDRARSSAQDMARRLLNSEFGAELETAKMSEPKTESKARAAAESENLMGWLREALLAAERGYDYLYVESFDAETGTVVYCLVREGESSRTYRRSYTLDGETVTLGAERMAVRRRVTYEDAPEMTGARAALPQFLVRALEAMGFRSGQGEDGASDVDLREAMWRALKLAIPAFVDIAEIFPEARTVIYSTRPEESMLWWRRTYEVDDEGAVTLMDDSERVEIEQSWKPVAAVRKPEQQSLELTPARGAEEGAPCGCSETKADGETARAATDEGGSTMSDKLKELAGRLIANERSPFDDSNRPQLEAMSEATLTALDANYQETAAEGDPPEEPAPEKAVEPPAEASATPAAPPVGTVNLKQEEYDRLIAATSSWEATEAQRKAEEAARKATLVASLKGAQDAFSEADLKALSLDHLTKLARTHELDAPAGAPDFSGRALANPSGGGYDVRARSDSWGVRSAAAKRNGEIAEGVN